MQDPIERKNRELQRLDKEMVNRRDELTRLTEKVNQAKDEAQKVLRKLGVAIQKAHKEFMDFVQTEAEACKELNK